MSKRKTPVATTPSGMTDFDRAVTALASLYGWPYTLNETGCIVQDSLYDPLTMCAGLQAIIDWARQQRGQPLPEDPKADLKAYLHSAEPYSMANELAVLPGWPHDWFKTLWLIKGLMGQFPEAQGYEISSKVHYWAGHGIPENPIETLQTELEKAYYQDLVASTIQEERLNAAKKARDAKAKH